MFAASKTDSVSAAGPDDKFNYVTMLLHGDGTNGAQNNTFLDSSTNAFSITRNGNTTQGSFSPYGSNWSNFFPSSSYLEIANNTALQMSTGDFTIEFWLNFSSLSNYQTIFTKGYNNAGGLLVQTNTGTGTLLIYVAGSVVITASSASTLGTWNHYALVRNSGTLTLYLNGTSVGSVSNSTNFNNTESFNVGGSVSGYYTNGYISNFRVVKGTAVYTGSFTPSTTPLTAITNTQLLTCQSNRFIDNSTNAFAITATGTPSVQRFNPFGTATAYSTSVIGGSGYFDGSGDYLQIADSSAFTFGSGDFTVEFWAYSSNTSLTLIIGQNNGNPAPSSFDVRYNGTTITGNIFSSGTTYAVAESMSKNAWHHVAFVRNGTSLRIYVDGVSTSSTAVSTVSVNDSSNVLSIGASSETTPGYYFNGYMTDARIVKGTAVYTSNFTPPTAPLTAITNTQLLTNFTNGAIYDNAMMNDLETVGNAQISTSVKKYGTGSLAFDGTGDYLVGNGFQGLGGNFTIEAWVYSLNWSSGAHVIVDTRDAWFSTTGLNFYFNDAGNLIMYVNGGDRITSATAYSLSTWYHVALVRSGSTITMYVDGTSVGTYTYSTALTDKTAIVGTATDNRNSGTSWKFNGYIDDLRITSGYARYTANFTAPTAAFSDTGPY